MTRDKRLAAALAAILGILLFICTIASQIIYQRLLPEVQVVEGAWSEGGFTLPADALFTGTQGDCAYYMEEKPGRFGTKYLVREVYVTVLNRNEAEGTVTVRGIYDPKWVYAAGDRLVLSDGLEVKVR